MSEENVEIVREGLAAWNRGDDALKAFVAERYAPDVTLHPFKDLADSQIRHGREALLLRLMEMREPWERSEVEAEELVDAGDYVVAALLVRAIVRGTADQVDMRLGYAYRFREGKITETHVFRTFAEALEAAGLRE
jgi:ketosteroid isomerase-like protein